MGPSDQSDWVSINRLSDKKAYTERVLPTYIFLSEILNKFITSAILAAIHLFSKNAWEDWTIYDVIFSKKVEVK